MNSGRPGKEECPSEIQQTSWEWHSVLPVLLCYLFRDHLCWREGPDKHPRLETTKAITELPQSLTPEQVKRSALLSSFLIENKVLSWGEYFPRNSALCFYTYLWHTIRKLQGMWRRRKTWSCIKKKEIINRSRPTDNPGAGIHRQGILNNCLNTLKNLWKKTNMGNYGVIQQRNEHL